MYEGLTGPGLDLEEIAQVLSTELRWKGQTIVDFSVLQHILAGATAVLDPVDRLYWLLHDVDEAWTGDVASRFKTDSQHMLAAKLRRDVEKHLGLPSANDTTAEVIKSIDMDSAIAEARILCHPVTYERVLEQCGPLQVEHLIDAVWELRDISRREAVSSYLEKVGECLEDSRVRSLIGRG